jgi:Homeodomain-like domain
VLIRPISRRSVCPEIYSSSLGPQTELRRRLVTVAAVDVERAADLYAQGWTLRQIGTELGLSSTTVSDQLRRAGVTMRRASPPATAHPHHRRLAVAALRAMVSIRVGSEPRLSGVD